jgi:hypothetical protein
MYEGRNFLNPFLTSLISCLFYIVILLLFEYIFSVLNKKHFDEQLTDKFSNTRRNINHISHMYVYVKKSFLVFYVKNNKSKTTFLDD